MNNSDFSDWHDIAVNVMNLSIESEDSAVVRDIGLTTDSGNLDGVASMYSKLEGMMNAVREEVSGLENMKSKMKDFGKLKEKLITSREKLKMAVDEISILRKKLSDSDVLINQFRIDMQRLNDLYGEERTKHTLMQTSFVRQEQALSHAQGELNFIQNELKVNADMKKQIKDLKATILKSQETYEEEKGRMLKNSFVLEQQLQDGEKVKSELGAHVWNLSEKIKSLKAAAEIHSAEKLQLETGYLQARENEQKLQETLMQKAQKEKDALDKSAAENESAQARHHALTTDLIELRRVVSDRNDRIQSLEDSVLFLEDELRKEKAGVQGKVGDVASLLSEAKAQIMDLDDRLKCSLTTIKDLEKRRENSVHDLAQKNDAIDAIELELQVCSLRSYVYLISSTASTFHLTKYNLGCAEYFE